MGVKRTVPTGEVDSLGRPIKVSADQMSNRASAPPPVASIDFEHRFDRIEGGKYAEALAVADARPWPRRDPGNWWDARRFLAEHNHEHGDYRQFPEAGLYETGLRTYRRCYQGNGNAIRMPSKAAISRFAKDPGGTFDLPVEFAGKDGGLVSTNVRCTQVAAGVWHVTACGRPASKAEVAAAEAVRAVLEAQRPTLALESAKDLMRRAESHAPVGAIRRTPVATSTFIKAAGFGRRTPVVTVEMHGKVYGYSVPLSDASAFASVIRQGGSVGAAYNEHVKGKPRVEIRDCRRCGAQVPVGDGLPAHICELHQRRSA